MIRTALVGVLGGWLTAAAWGAEPTELEGLWKPVSITSGGMSIPKENLAKLQMSLLIKGNTITLKSRDNNGNIKEEAVRFELNTATKPKSIDFTLPSDEVKKGIYVLEGDTLRLCWDDDGDERPKEFASKPETDLILFVLKRDK
ncbi:MAG: TIGR03067 domain-containing protein [Gemmataceae bacterium]